MVLIAKFRLKLRTLGKTTRPFRYNVNHIPFDYTVEASNRFKGLDLVGKSAERCMDRSSQHSTGGSDQNHSKEKEIQEVKVKVSQSCLTLCEPMDYNSPMEFSRPEY